MMNRRSFLGKAGTALLGIATLGLLGNAVAKPSTASNVAGWIGYVERTGYKGHVWLKDGSTLSGDFTSIEELERWFHNAFARHGHYPYARTLSRFYIPHGYCAL